MGQKIWVALLGFAVLIFAGLGLLTIALWWTHRISGTEALGAVGMMAFIVSGSYRALLDRLAYNAAHRRKGRGKVLALK